MSTVIIGGGIIGASTAYYLSLSSANNPSSSKDDEIHVIESSSHPFSGASGYAGGFLAKNWFAPALAPLGAYSFELHKQLAAEFDGNRKWGYMPATALSLDLMSRAVDSGDGQTGYDWLQDEKSRALAAGGGQDDTSKGETIPAWLTKQKGSSLEVIGDESSCGQVDPLRLCQFLNSASTYRGVKWHHPAEVVSVATDSTTNLLNSVTVRNSETQTEYTLPCRNLIICAGPWTSLVYKTLFPSSPASVQPHISSLAGYSLVVHSPRHTLLHEHDQYKGHSHTVFTSLRADEGGFSPEIFAREGAEIYIAGLNPSDTPLPSKAEEAKASMDKNKLAELKKVAVRLLGKQAETGEAVNEDDLQITREGLCFRPVSNTGLPIVSRVKDENLSQIKATDNSAAGRKTGGVFIAAGHGPWGISQSLGTGKVVADMVDGIEPAVDVKLLSL